MHYDPFGGSCRSSGMDLLSSAFLLFPRNFPSRDKKRLAQVHQGVETEPYSYKGGEIMGVGRQNEGRNIKFIVLMNAVTPGNTCLTASRRKGTASLATIPDRSPGAPAL